MMEICNPQLKLSQNERAAILENEKKKWRIFRIQQVREQSKNEAKRILKSVKEVEAREKLRIENLVKEKWEEEKKKQVEELEEKCVQGMQKFGEAHRRAKMEVDEMQAHKERRKRDDEVATERGRIASRKLDKEKAASSEKENTHRLQKEKTLQREKRRACKMASLPTPQKFKHQRKPMVKIPKKVTFHEAGTFITSSYIPSKLKIVKEKKIDHNAKECAENETKKHKQMEEMKMKREEENNRKIDERGKKAQKREKTKEMFSKLMKELQAAEEDHRLEEFLQGDDDVEGVKAEVLSKNLVEKIAEARTKNLINEGNIDNAAVPVRPQKALSKIEDVGRLSTEKEIKFGIQGLTYTIRDLEAVDETDKDHQAMTQPLLKVPRKPISIMKETLQKVPKNIHLKETVPVHKIPIIKEKFRIKIPEETLSTDNEVETSTDVSSESSETLKDVSEMIKNDESSFEELKIKVTVNPFASESSSEVSFPVQSKLKETITSEATEYFDLPKPKTSIEKVVINRSSSSSGMTEYYDVPHTSSEDSNKIRKNIESVQERGKRIRKLLDKLNRPQILKIENNDILYTSSEESNQIKRNIKCIQEGGKRVRELINELKQPQIISPPELKPTDNISAFKTPPRIYTESLKAEESSSKPVSKREKADKLKKLILEHYIPIVIKARGKELKQITASTVDGSGLSLSTERNMSDLVKYINVSRKDSSVSSIPTLTSDIVNISDLDIVPSKLSSSTPIIITTSTTSSGASALSNDASACLASSSSVSSDVCSLSQEKIVENVHCDTEMQKQIYSRLLELQRLKQQVILMQQNALNQQGREELKSSTIGSRECDTSKSSGQQHSKNGESTVEWSSSSEYQTPTREASTQSWEELSSVSCTQAVEESVDGAPHTATRHISSSLIKNQNIPEDVVTCDMIPVEFREYNPSEYSSCASESSRASPRSSVNPSSSKGEEKSGDKELPFQKELQILSDSLLKLASTLKVNPSSVVSTPSAKENTPVSSGEGNSSVPTGDGTTPISSSSSSFPDMNEVLQKFGLCWASSMLKKMDNAEKDSSSEDGSVR